MKTLLVGLLLLSSTTSFALERPPVFRVPEIAIVKTPQDLAIEAAKCQVKIGRLCSASDLENFRKSVSTSVKPPIQLRTEIVIQQEPHNHLLSYHMLIQKDLHEHTVSPSQLQRAKSDFLGYMEKMQVPTRQAELHKKFTHELTQNIARMERPNFVAMLADIGQMGRELGQSSINAAMSVMIRDLSPNLSRFLVQMEDFAEPNEFSAEAYQLKLGGYEKAFSDVQNGGFLTSHIDGVKFGGSSSAPVGQYTLEDRAWASLRQSVKRSAEFAVGGAGAGAFLGGAAGGGAGAIPGGIVGGILGGVTGALGGAIEGYMRPGETETKPTGIERTTERVVTEGTPVETKNAETGEIEFVITREVKVTITETNLETKEKTINTSITKEVVTVPACDGKPCPAEQKSNPEGCDKPYEDYSESFPLTAEERKKQNERAKALADLKRESLIFLLEPQNAKLTASEAIRKTLKERREQAINWGVDGPHFEAINPDGWKPIDPLFDPNRAND